MLHQRVVDERHALHESQQPVERAANRAHRLIPLCRLGRIIAGGFFRRDLDVRISRNQVVGNGDPLHDLDALRDQRVIFHVAHGDEAVDALEPQPMDHVRHQLLKARILHAGNAFRALEIGRGRIAALLPLAGIVDQELGDLPERAAFLAVVDDDADPPAWALRAHSSMP